MQFLKRLGKVLILALALAGASSVALIPMAQAAAAPNWGSRNISLGMSGSDVTVLQQKLQQAGTFKSQPTGYFGSVTKQAVLAFQKARSIPQTGTAGPLTRKALENLGNPNALPLDWFKEVAQIMPVGTVATVTDLWTGKSYQVKRTGGVKHADVEPLSTKDTEIQKSLANGWSWNRRPAVISFKGWKIAASIHTMPHGYDSLTNGMAGHTCIHFLNSRTHGGNSLDAAHQGAVWTAAGWKL